jgi:hypothetical protein
MPDRAARDLERQRKATFDLDKERLSLDQERIDLEHRKLVLEDRKIEMENRKLELEDRKIAINLYLEDFKARWQELLNFENENNRWITLYVTALLLVISWVLNNSTKYTGLEGLYSYGDNAYFIMSIAIVNAVYTFAMAFKGYQIQQIALYQYDRLAGKIVELTKVPFNEWERFRREEFANARGPEPIRKFYFGVISLLPTIVSYTILGLYFFYQWSYQAGLNHWRSGRNWFAFGAFILVTLSLVFSWMTARLNRKWDVLLEATKHRSGNKSLPGSTNERDRHLQLDSK